MLEFAVFTFGMLASFLLSGLRRNKKAQRANPPMLHHMGLVMMGFSGTMGILLLGYAAAIMLQRGIG
ncbi:hypothetical protein RN629_00515 [Sphingomonadaceae bacterium jetA1]|jgi:hypothetical protein|uniref:hypothetical protein n=1 Tax=Facivitalis istanbulensis TaxID=3075838 RepID=UPI0034706BD4